MTNIYSLASIINFPCQMDLGICTIVLYKKIIKKYKSVSSQFIYHVTYIYLNLLDLKKNNSQAQI